MFLSKDFGTPRLPRSKLQWGKQVFGGISFCFSNITLVTDQTFGAAELLLFGSDQMTEPFLQNNEHFFFMYYTLHFSKLSWNDSRNKDAPSDRIVPKVITKDAGKSPMSWGSPFLKKIHFIHVCLSDLKCCLFQFSPKHVQCSVHRGSKNKCHVFDKTIFRL